MLQINVFASVDVRYRTFFKNVVDPTYNIFYTVGFRIVNSVPSTINPNHYSFLILARSRLRIFLSFRRDSNIHFFTDRGVDLTTIKRVSLFKTFLTDSFNYCKFCVSCWLALCISARTDNSEIFAIMFFVEFFGFYFNFVIGQMFPFSHNSPIINKCNSKRLRLACFRLRFEIT